eukprot:CAMPEP_0177231436 /NCGR_PEP_ID=MMETSP0367-20130122/42759_1 /TAXON_ID=447022 ORGANISM="Scrippsiella hangoei-like, Strain SHHI-4" /NCGR_SAMPLE_ID=MMETSP0367 /ASSEMBLY_ACC=CAM_ASM_000362 /LENGTH=103 /DNA_ID=CAMNT_0018681957 /DNA_START=416 /DNA_END=725 /DNA_ORIENTATION=+
MRPHKLSGPTPFCPPTFQPHQPDGDHAPSSTHLEDFLRGQLPEFLDRRLQLAFERAVLRLNVSQPQNLRGYILDPPVFRGVALATRASLRGSQAVGGEDGALH